MSYASLMSDLVWTGAIAVSPCQMANLSSCRVLALAALVCSCALSFNVSPASPAPRRLAASRLDAHDASAPRDNNLQHRRAALSSLAALAWMPAMAAAAENDDCLKGCLKECTSLAPGAANVPYCKDQCDDYCKGSGPKGVADIVRSEPSVTTLVDTAVGGDTARATGSIDKLIGDVFNQANREGPDLALTRKDNANWILIPKP